MLFNLNFCRKVYFSFLHGSYDFSKPSTAENVSRPRIFFTRLRYRCERGCGSMHLAAGRQSIRAKTRAAAGSLVSHYTDPLPFPYSPPHHHSLTHTSSLVICLASLMTRCQFMILVKDERTAFGVKISCYFVYKNDFYNNFINMIYFDFDNSF